MTPSGAQLLMQALLDQKVETVFGYPGGAIMPTYDALYDVGDRIHHVLVRHEQGAIHAAQGFARASGKTGVCLATSGPGATNLITGLTDALMDSTPLVCITGQVKSNLLGSDAFQEADTIGLSLAATKWNYRIHDAREIPHVIHQAFHIARTGRPGPVLIDIPRDVQSEPVADAHLTRSHYGIHHPHYGAWGHPEKHYNPAALQAAADLINHAERPLLMAGHGVLLAGAQCLLRQLADTSGLPVATTLLGLSALPCDHPLYVGMLGMHGHYGPNRLTNEADVIVAVGMRFDDRVTGRLEEYACRARIIHIEIEPAELNRHVPVTVPLVGDARQILEQLLPLIQLRRHDSWLTRFRNHDAEEYHQVVRAELQPAGGPLRMGEVVAKLSDASRGQALLVTDVGQHQMMAARYYRFLRPYSHITSGGAGTMGFALPAALGAKLAAPDREVIAIMGDGGFQMTLQELGTIAQEALPIKMIVLNNGYLGMVRQWQQLFFDERYSFVRMPQPDFTLLCRAYGIDACQVETRIELDAAMDELLAANRPYLIDVKVAPMANVFPMIPSGASVSEIRLS